MMTYNEATNLFLELKASTTGNDEQIAEWCKDAGARIASVTTRGRSVVRSESLARKYSRKQDAERVARQYGCIGTAQVGQSVHVVKVTNFGHYLS